MSSCAPIGSIDLSSDSRWWWPGKSRSRKYLSTSGNSSFRKRIKAEMSSSPSLRSHLTKTQLVSYYCTPFRYYKLTDLRHYRQVPVGYLDQTLSIGPDNVDYVPFHSLGLCRRWDPISEFRGSFICVLVAAFDVVECVLRGPGLDVALRTFCSSGEALSYLHQLRNPFVHYFFHGGGPR